MGYTPAVAACAAALLAPATFARRGSSGSLCRTDQNAGELEPASCPDGVAQPRSLCPTLSHARCAPRSAPLSPAQPRSAPLVVPHAQPRPAPLSPARCPFRQLPVPLARRDVQLRQLRLHLLRQQTVHEVWHRRALPQDRPVDVDRCRPGPDGRPRADHRHAGREVPRRQVADAHGAGGPAGRAAGQVHRRGRGGLHAAWRANRPHQRLAAHVAHRHRRAERDRAADVHAVLPRPPVGRRHL